MEKNEILFWFSAIFMVVWLAATTPMLFWIPDVSPALGIGFVMIYGWALYRLYEFIFQAQIYAKKREKERKNLVGDRVVQNEIVFFEDSFCFHSAVSGSKYEHPYEAVRDLQETKDYYVIFVKGNTAMSFAKNGDTEGSMGQVFALLREKGSIKA